MSADVEYEQLVVAFSGKPAWHKLGHVLPEGSRISATEALPLGNVDYDVEKAETWALTSSGEMVADEESRLLVRGPIKGDEVHRVFGRVGPDYTVVQNREIAAMLDPLTERWPTETVGALKGGRVVFFCLDAGTGTLNGDEIHRYFLVTDGKDGTASASILYTPVRVVCRNTFNVAHGRAIGNIVRLPHSAGVKQDMQLYVTLMSQLHTAQRRLEERLERFAQVKLAQPDVAAVLEASYPEPERNARVVAHDSVQDLPVDLDVETLSRLSRAKERFQGVVEARKQRRAEAGLLYVKFNDEYPGHARTAWALWNAVTEAEDHRGGKGGVKTIAESILFGERAEVKSRAFSALSKLD